MVTFHGERRGQDGFVNVNLPEDLDREIDTLVTKGTGPANFARKKQVWQAAVQLWLQMRPDLHAGVAYLHTRATKDLCGSTGFVQRRVELGTELELGVRRLAAELADEKGRAFALARIIYTALDYYVRQIALPSRNATCNSLQSLSPVLECGDAAISDKQITLEINLKKLEAPHIARFVEIMSRMPGDRALRWTVDKEAARDLLTDLAARGKMEDGYLISELTKRLGQLDAAPYTSDDAED
jgi:Arc/MetJ-type ribon-helix-helix transcriptional regulator